MSSENNIVREATRSARRAVLLAIGGAALIVLGLAGDQAFFRHLHRVSLERAFAAHEARDTIIAAKDQMRYSATLAAVTGEQVWIDRYNLQIPVVEQAFEQAFALAEEGSIERLRTETLVSEAQLLEFDRRAFEAVRAGKLADAQAILSSPLYHQHDEIMSTGVERFLDAVLASVAQENAEAATRERILFSMLIPLGAIAAITLWRHLNISLRRSEGAHIAAEGRIRRLALNDVLTGLPNRLAIHDGLKHAMEQAAAENTKVAFLMIDLDRFKPVNDRHGHLIGDLVLKEVARRLGKIIRSQELCGRFGGDEFVAVVEYADDDEIPRRVGQRIVEHLAEPMLLQGLTVEIGASVGLAVFPTDAREDDDLMSKADIALYKAKSAGRGAVRWFDANMDIDLRKRVQLEAELGSAIKTREIVPYYQPIINLETGRLSGFEVLARWHHPSNGTISPGEFIPLAEKSGLIDELMLGVLQRACLDLRSLPQDLTIGINVAPRQIQDERLAHRILAVLSKTRFSPKRLEVELTESALVSDINAAKSVIRSLKSLGIKVALDDFGTGYSSLSYLSDLPFDKIKIDRSFIRTLHDRRESMKIVSAIIGLGRSLGASTVAEGVESARDEAVLRAMNCTLAQGYLYAKPISGPELPDLVEKLAQLNRAISA